MGMDITKLSAVIILQCIKIFNKSCTVKIIYVNYLSKKKKKLAKLIQMSINTQAPLHVNILRNISLYIPLLNILSHSKAAEVKPLGLSVGRFCTLPQPSAQLPTTSHT